jgi:glycosyltransferase involved in cell wall biosynthesis
MSESNMKLSVIIPVFNEEKTILEILRRVQNVPVEKEIIIVDDGSTDGTREILEGFFSSHSGMLPFEEKRKPGQADVSLVLKDKNEGKGSAIREGLKHVTGNVVVIQDGDLEYDPMDWIKMLKLMEEKEASVVYGSRILGKGRKSSFAFYFGGRLLSFLTNLLYGSGITDEPTCYKMFRTDVIKSIRLESMGFEFCPEVTSRVLRKGYRIFEVPIKYEPRMISEGKKIRWKDGVIAIKILLKNRFRND